MRWDKFTRAMPWFKTPMFTGAYLGMGRVGHCPTKNVLNYC